MSGVVEGRDQFLKVLCMESPQTRVSPSWNFNAAKGLLLRKEPGGNWVVLRSSTLTGWTRYLIYKHLSISLIKILMLYAVSSDENAQIFILSCNHPKISVHFLKWFPILPLIIWGRNSLLCVLSGVGLNLQVLWGDLGGSSSCCHPQRSKDQLDLQPGAQAQRASRTHICW